ncbi:hypothetical protein MZJ48_002834 [Vibrio parahaemolyticus]|nr:hypothetical protein [Vibrio parahaemolyticus]EJC7121647.1 hypothetical protein [Vibrio parahaemolyticus]
MSEEVQEGCGNLPIRGSMSLFSRDFLASCEKYSELVESAESPQDIRIFNTSCVISSVSFIEARLNEEIAIARMCYNDEPEGQPWKVVESMQKKLSIQEKWDLISVISGGSRWDASQQPFQSFEIILALRNELVHYKALLTAQYQGPNRKITGLMTALGIESTSSWVGDDCSTWTNDLLGSKLLSPWVLEKIVAFDREYHSLREHT